MIWKNLRLLGLAGLAAMAMSAHADRVIPVPSDLDGVHLSGDGRVATGSKWVGITVKSYVWTAETGDQPLGRDTFPLAGCGWPAVISGDGNTIAQTILADAGNRGTAGVWQSDIGWRELGPLPPGGGIRDGCVFDSDVFGISRDGKVVTGQFNLAGGVVHGFVWTAETGMVDMGRSGVSSSILGANANGSVVVGWDQSPRSLLRNAAVWVRGTLMLLDDEQTPGQANAVNGDGTIVVGETNGNLIQGSPEPAMWKWQDGAWVRTLLAPLYPEVKVIGGYPRAVSDDGRVVVGQGYRRYGGQGSYGFVWTPSTGMIAADGYLKSLGYDLGSYSVYDTYTVTPNGQTIAVEYGCPGFVSCIMYRVPTPAGVSGE